MRTAASLDALNFALAGAREGFGPLPGVYLQQFGWGSGAFGAAMSAARLAGVLLNPLLGAAIDPVPAKRGMLVGAVATIALGAVLIVLAGRTWAVWPSQFAIGIADDAIFPPCGRPDARP